MAQNPPALNPRLAAILRDLEDMASGQLDRRIPISDDRDELDAVAHGINVMAGELVFRMNELNQAQAELVQAGKLAALGVVTSGLAHELNNPLAIIRGFAEVIESALDEGRLDDVRRAVKKIDGSVERMAAIIRHVMDFSRQSDAAPAPFLLNDVVRGALLIVSEQLRLRSIDVELDLDASEPRLVGSLNRIEQVLLNLIANSRDAIFETGRGAGTLSITTRGLAQYGSELEVRDDGIGMTDEVRARMFDPFFTTKALGKGTGLGCSISLGIVKEHGGEIFCESRRGFGTRIVVSLPSPVQDAFF